jgi:hypothetical protein
MKQNYYMTEDVDCVEHISDDLHKIGIQDDHIHVVGENIDAIESHHLHAAREIDETDIVRSSERGGIVGIVLGTLFVLGASFYQPFGIVVEGPALVMCTLLIVGFCAWWGGIAGVYFDNYRISAFHDAIRQGKYLLMVDTKPAQEKAVRTMMSGQHPEAKWMGRNSTIANPFHA